MDVFECYANVSKFGERHRVRVNFRYKLKNLVGGASEVREVEEPEFYQKFFSKVDKALFIEKEGV